MGGGGIVEKFTNLPDYDVFGGTVPPSYVLFGGTVPSNCVLFGRPCPPSFPNNGNSAIYWKDALPIDMIS